MATKVTETLISDLSGEKADVTVPFSVNGQDYTIDLTNEEAAGFQRFLKPFTDNAVRVGKPDKSKGARPHAAPTGPKPDLAKIRAWARKNGHQVASQGRVSTTVMLAYRDAHLPPTIRPPVAARKEAPAPQATFTAPETETGTPKPEPKKRSARKAPATKAGDPVS